MVDANTSVRRVFEYAGYQLKGYSDSSHEKLLMRCEYDYDDKTGLCVGIRYLNELQLPTTYQGVASVRYNSEETCLDEQGQLMLQPGYGIAGYSFEYNYENGRYVNQSVYFDTEREPIVYEGKGYAIVQREFKKGYRVKAPYYRTWGELISAHQLGYAVEISVRDDDGNEADIRYFDEQDQPMIHPTYGDAWFHKTYDADGNLLEMAHYDTEDQLMYVKKDGYAIQRRHYDPDGNEDERRYLDEQEHLIIHPKQDYAIIKMKYENGRLVEEPLYDENEHLMIHEDYGCAMRRREYDDDGNLRIVS